METSRYVSTMENTNPTQAATELAALKDLEMAGFVEAAKDPLWVWPVVGLFAGGFLASFEFDSNLVSIVASIGYVLGIFLLVGFVIQRRGVQPRLNNMPTSLNRVFLFYCIGVAVVAAVIMGIGFGVSFIYAGIAAFVLISAGGIWYHLTWRKAVDTLVAP